MGGPTTLIGRSGIRISRATSRRSWTRWGSTKARRGWLLHGGCGRLLLATGHPDKLVALSMAYDLSGMQPDYLKMIPQMRPEMFVGSPIEKQWKTLSPHPGRFVLFVEKMIALEHEPVAWKERVRQLKSPTLLVTGDADAWSRLSIRSSCFACWAAEPWAIWGANFQNPASPFCLQVRIRQLFDNPIC